jgi:DNA-nicking Smr family endonuclease
MNRTRKNKEVLNMNNEITFHKAQSDSPSDNDIQLIQNMFPEFKYNYIKKLLKKNHLNKESTIEELLSERFIQQTVSENDIKRNSKILEIYNNNANRPKQEVVIDGSKTVIVNDITTKEIHIPQRENSSSSSKSVTVSEEPKPTSPPVNSNDDGTSHHRKKRNRKRNKRNSRLKDKEEEEDKEENNEENNSNENSTTVPTIQSYFKLSEIKSMFPDISDRLLILSLQVNKGNLDEVINYLLMHNNIKDEINEDDICRSLELQLANEQGNKTTCDGNCINQGYPCFIHSRLILTKDDEYNTLTLSEIMKVWNKFELMDRNVNIGFADQEQAIKYYTEDNEEIEFLILNRIKEAEKAMTPEERKHQDDVEYFRNREEQLKQHKHKFFSEASRKYRAGGMTGFSSAAYYSAEGRQLQDEIDKIKLLAVSAQIKKNEENYMRNNGLNSFCGVDLHGLTVKEAIPYLSDMLNIWKTEVMKYNPKYQKKNPTVNAMINTTTETYDFGNSQCKSFSKVVSSAPKPNPTVLHNVKITKVETIKKKKTRCIYPRVFHIITGRGIHSDANIGARLKPSILNYLRNHNFNFVEINSGSIEVRL